MDTTRARELVALESRRIEATLTELADDLAMDAELEVQQTGDDDAGNGLATEMTERALQSDYLLRLAAVERAEARIAAGTFGRSVETGALIPDQRLDANPLAERTVEDQRRFEAESASADQPMPLRLAWLDCVCAPGWPAQRHRRRRDRRRDHPHVYSIGAGWVDG